MRLSVRSRPGPSNGIFVGNLWETQGRRPLSYLFRWRPLPDSNRCCRRERAISDFLGPTIRRFRPKSIEPVSFLPASDRYRQTIAVACAFRKRAVDRQTFPSAPLRPSVALTSHVNVRVPLTC